MRAAPRKKMIMMTMRKRFGFSICTRRAAAARRVLRLVVTEQNDAAAIQIV